MLLGSEPEDECTLLEEEPGGLTDVDDACRKLLGESDGMEPGSKTNVGAPLEGKADSLIGDDCAEVDRADQAEVIDESWLEGTLLAGVLEPEGSTGGGGGTDVAGCEGAAGLLGPGVGVPTLQCP